MTTSQSSLFSVGQRNQYCPHSEHPPGSALPKPHDSITDHQRTVHQDRETHISKEMCASIPPFQMARSDPIRTQDWQCPQAPGSDSSPSVSTHKQDPVPFPYPLFFVLNRNNATWQNGNLTSPAGFPGARNCVGCH